MSILRQIERNKLKMQQENNKIRKAWRMKQVDKYSIDRYCKIYNRNITSKQQRINPKEIYNI